MPVAEFAFVVNSVPPRDAQEEVLRKAREVFGEKTKFVAFAGVTGGNIRFFKKRGLRVTKAGGRFYVSGDPERQIVRAKIDIPQEYLIRKMGGTPGDVDLSELADAASGEPTGPTG